METGEAPEQLNLDEIQKLDAGNRTDYLAIRRMVESDGWRLFNQWLGSQAQAIVFRQLTANTWEQVMLARGGKGAFDTVASFESIAEQTYRHVLESIDAAGTESQE